MKQFKLGLVLLVVIAVSGCGMFQSKAKTSVMTYDVVGSVLIEFQKQAKPMCDNGIIKGIDCIELQNRYNQARVMFICAGEVLAKGIDNPDALSIFQSNMEELNKVLPIIIDIMSKYGIQIKKKEGK